MSLFAYCARDTVSFRKQYLIVCVQSISTLPPRRAAEAPGVDIIECGARKVVAEAGVEVESGVAAVVEQQLRPLCLSVTEEAAPIFCTAISD